MQRGPRGRLQAGLFRFPHPQSLLQHLAHHVPDQGSDLICACTGVPRKDFDWSLGTTGVGKEPAVADVSCGARCGSADSSSVGGAVAWR
jgi:hypothetical protein